ncbi:MAG TPA: 30S ribosomal protein S10 [archaeon]|nr:30S ribosomal protein S10 [archaeon]
MQTARIKLSSPDYGSIEEICGKIQEVAERTGAKHSGTIPLPTKKLVVPTRKGPCGGGTESYEKWQMRVHKRIIDIQADETTLRRVMRVEIPENVHVEIELKEKK